MMKRSALTCSLLALLACREDDVDTRELGGPGEPCEPVELGDDPPCEDGLTCDPSGAPSGDGGWVCANGIELRGTVYDALTGDPIEGALVTALDEASTPVSTAVTTDADGNYTLTVTGRRDAEGNPATDVRWTLFASANGYQSLPSGLRPAVPIAGSEAVDTDEGFVIESGTTELGLLALPETGDTSTIHGRIEATTPAGTMVMAINGDGSAVHTIADSSGSFTLFNVPRGETSLWGCRRGLELKRIAMTVEDEEHSDVVLAEITSELSELASLSGNISIVDASGDAATSVVLVPAPMWQPVLERGPVPLGLRAPSPPDLPTISGQFAIEGIPSGTYKVLAAFENDALVRDPDTGIAGTEVVEVTLEPGEQRDLGETFKVTGALELHGPGADGPEVVQEPPVLRWADDSSETHYGVVVHDALGELVWEDLEVPAHMGSDVSLEYAGPALEPGMTYQFRVTSYRMTAQGTSAISRSEDLRGIFVFRP